MDAAVATWGTQLIFARSVFNTMRLSARPFVVGSAMACGVLGFAPLPAAAQTGVTISPTAYSNDAATARWTSPRLADPPERIVSRPTGSAPIAPGTRTFYPGAAPTIKPWPALAQMRSPMRPRLRADATRPPADLGFGYFTESRVFPPPTASTDSYEYPLSTVGILDFHDPKSNQGASCTAWVFPWRIIVTAGHCVAHAGTTASQRYFFTNFVFKPSYHDENGYTPLGVWTTTYALVANAWYQSEGSVPNPQDWAVVIAADKVDKNGTHKLGEVTGGLGVATYALDANHLTILGYPDNLDDGVLLQRNDAQTYSSPGTNVFDYGSNFLAGAGGAPFVQDMGVPPAGVYYPFNFVAGVASFASKNSTSPGYLAASQFDSNFVSLLKQACDRNAGNC
jgi:V8-like Glu-specific endopeptidase